MIFPVFVADFSKCLPHPGGGGGGRVHPCPPPATALNITIQKRIFVRLQIYDTVTQACCFSVTVSMYKQTKMGSRHRISWSKALSFIVNCLSLFERNGS